MSHEDIVRQSVMLKATQTQWIWMWFSPVYFVGQLLNLLLEWIEN